MKETPMSGKLREAVLRYQDGEQKAFEDVYQLSCPYLFTCVKHLVNDEDAVQDILQETYLDITKNIKQLKQPESFLNWAAVIANRKCIEYYRKNGQFPLADIGSVEDSGAEGAADNEEFLPEDILQNREKNRLLWEIIDGLSQIQRFCVVAFYFEEMSQQQIAELAGIPVNTVKSHLNRAKKKIKEAVMEIEKKDGTKLYALAPFLLLLFGMEAEACKAPMMPSKLADAAGISENLDAGKPITGNGTQKTDSEKPAGEPAGTADGGTSMGKSASLGKIAAVAAAACVIAGAAAVILMLAAGRGNASKPQEEGALTAKEGEESENKTAGDSTGNVASGEELFLESELFATEEYEDFGVAYGGSIPVKKDGMWGVVNYANEVIVPFAYDGIISVPDYTGNLVLYRSSDGGGECFVFDNKGELLYQEEGVGAWTSGGIYTVGPRYEYDYVNDIGYVGMSYYNPDGTELATLDYCSDNPYMGFYEGVSTLCARPSGDEPYQIVTVDLQGNITWRPAPFGEMESRLPDYYNDTQEIGESSALETEGHFGEANVASAGFYIDLGNMVSTMNHGYYVIKGIYDSMILMYDADDNQIAYFNWRDLSIDETGKVGMVKYYYDESLDYSGFCADGSYLYHYGSKMVFHNGKKYVLMDLAKNPDPWSLDPEAVVTAVYDWIGMWDADYWLVQSGEKWGYINHDGEEMAMYEDAGHFVGGYAMIIEAGEAYLINADFEKVQKLGKADSVFALGELYCVKVGDVTHICQIGDYGNAMQLETHKGTVTASKGENEVQKVVSYTGIEINEDELIQLVKGTITSAKKRLQDALDNGDTGRVRVMLPAIEDARKRNALNETFKPLGDSLNPLREENRDWTFMEAASSLGYLLFEGKNLERGYLYKSNFCKYFVSQGLYDFDVEKCQNFEIDTPSGVSFYDEKFEDFDVNFKIFFEYGDKKWVALVGNINNLYTILDIVEEDSLNGIITINETEEPEIESIPVEDEPEVKNGPNRKPGKEQPSIKDNSITKQ